MELVNIVNHKTRPTRVCVVVSIAVTTMTLASLVTPLQRLSAEAQKVSGTTHSFRRMADGRQWTSYNLDVKTTPSYCYDDLELNCHRYGRLYTWDAATRACPSLGGGWRLPTDEEWRQLARHYGGVSEDSDDRGKAAYKALLAEGSSGFNALLGGGRSVDGHYARLEAHGFYWTASESDPASGVFYNFGRGGQALHRQSDGEKKQAAFSVRCVKE